MMIISNRFLIDFLVFFFPYIENYIMCKYWSFCFYSNIYTSYFILLLSDADSTSEESAKRVVIAVSCFSHDLWGMFLNVFPLIIRLTVICCQCEISGGGEEFMLWKYPSIILWNSTIKGRYCFLKMIFRHSLRLFFFFLYG